MSDTPPRSMLLNEDFFFAFLIYIFWGGKSGEDFHWANKYSEMWADIVIIVDLKSYSTPDSTSGSSKMIFTVEVTPCCSEDKQGSCDDW